MINEKLKKGIKKWEEKRRKNQEKVRQSVRKTERSSRTKWKQGRKLWESQLGRKIRKSLKEKEQHIVQHPPHRTSTTKDRPLPHKTPNTPRVRRNEKTRSPLGPDF